MSDYVTRDRERRLEVWQYNCNKDRAVMLDLQSHLDGGRVDVVLIQEPYCYKGAVRGLSANYSIFESKETDSRGPRAAIVICRKRVNPELIPELVGDVGVCVRMRLQWGVVHFVSLYCTFGGRIREQIDYLSKVMRYVSGGLLLIGMDANASSEEWHCKTLRQDERTRRGDTLASWLEENRLIVLNQPTVRYTYIGSGGPPSDIDLTVRSAGWPVGTGFSWEILDQGVSDHSIIRIVVGRNVEQAGPGPQSSETAPIARRSDMEGIRWRTCTGHFMRPC